MNPPDPWLIELVVVRSGSYSASERRSLGRDVERTIFTRLGPGQYVRTSDLAGLTPEGRHILALRARAATAVGTVVFSHWSAAVLHGLPVLRSRLGRIHATATSDGVRHRTGLSDHLFALDDAEVVDVRGLPVTGIGRTVVDLAGAVPLDEGVLAADAALASGLPRAVLEAAVDLAGPRRAAKRIDEAIAFAHPGAETAAESRARVTAYRIGTEVPVLQQRFRLDGGGSAFVDEWFPAARAVLEIDGAVKYLDPRMATAGAGLAVLEEKRREDQIRPQTDGFARAGWVQSGSVMHLRPVLARVGVHPVVPRRPLSEWAASARAARPRRPNVLLG